MIVYIFSVSKNKITQPNAQKLGWPLVNNDRIVIWGKLQIAHQTPTGHIALAYLGISKKPRATLDISLWNNKNEKRS